MKIIRTADEMRCWTAEQHVNQRVVGFVPTMGYLHEAHLSLVDLAMREVDVVAVSIFVNPTQFGPGEDYETYPRDEERDLELLRGRGVEAVYMPSVQEMYPEGYSTYVDVEHLGDYLCGASRPGHFRGVTTVVTKLLIAVRPDVAVFGRKDAQQARIIQRMTEDLQFGIRIVLGPTLREEDGLAMSSRNIRLTPDHRKQAPALHASLTEARLRFEAGERDAIKLVDLVNRLIRANAPAGRIDYVQVVDWENLRPVSIIESESLLALAVYFGNVRLIDNVILKP